MRRLSGGGGNYSRPSQTYQETLSTDDIKEKLNNYKKVEDISTVPLQTHMRYFVYKENDQTKKMERLFRLGGKLINKDNYKQYVVLCNGKHTWSVNTKTAVFWKEKNIEEVKEEYEAKILRLKAKLAAEKNKV